MPYDQPTIDAAVAIIQARIMATKWASDARLLKIARDEIAAGLACVAQEALGDREEILVKHSMCGRLICSRRYGRPTERAKPRNCR